MSVSADVVVEAGASRLLRQHNLPMSDLRKLVRHFEEHRDQSFEYVEGKDDNQ
jgi:hypothetical protein